MDKKTFVKKALELYRQAEIDRKRPIIKNENHFNEWAEKQYENGLTLRQILEPRNLKP